MIRRLPIISSSANIRDAIFAVNSMRSSEEASKFIEMLSAAIGAGNIYLTSSGVSACYLILTALSKISPKKEVVLSAYTAGSLVVAIRKAGLKPVLADISLDDFNADTDKLSGAVNDDTLAVLAIHMFGITSGGLGGLRNNLPEGTFLVEDCCQAMGSVTLGRTVGSLGDVSFFSFNRGKNLPLCGGGCIATDDLFITKAIEPRIHELAPVSALGEFSAFVKTLAFSASTNPYVYGPAYAVVSRFKESFPPDDIAPERMSNFQIALGGRLMWRLGRLTDKRYENGMYLLKGLAGLSGVIIPKIHDRDRPAFGRLPIIFKNTDKRALAEEMLSRSGIESSRMYLRPLHHMFDLGYNASDFPNAIYLAERLLTIPVYSKLKKRDLDLMIKIIDEAAR